MYTKTWKIASLVHFGAFIIFYSVHFWHVKIYTTSNSAMKFSVATAFHSVAVYRSTKLLVSLFLCIRNCSVDRALFSFLALIVIDSEHLYSTSQSYLLRGTPSPTHDQRNKFLILF